MWEGRGWFVWEGLGRGEGSSRVVGGEAPRGGILWVTCPQDQEFVNHRLPFNNE